MANDNNNINELVADDDPTAELEIPSFSRIDENIAESVEKTFGAENLEEKDVSAGVAVSELKSDLLSRKKIINELQYDIQQLQTKWLGLETEIGVRESQTAQLNEELASSRDSLAQKEKLVEKRNVRIKALKSELRQRDDHYRKLEIRLGDPGPPAGDPLPSTDDAGSAMDLQSRLRRTEEYADEIRQQAQDLLESNSNAQREIESLSHRLTDATQINTQITEELAATVAIVEELQSRLDDIQGRHEKEIRLLRFELGEAQDTVVQSEVINSKLASDLVDVHSFKDELERMLGDVEEQSSERIEELQKEVVKLGRKTDTYEQKLTTKSEAISVLLAELAKKSEKIDSVGEIEGVIHDIDDRISEHSSGNGQPENRATADRITRLLIGTVDDQLLRFPLFKDRLTIGRTDDNDIQLKAAYVSRRHAVIQTDGDTTRIIDWGSKNGIQVNSSKVGEHFLAHGDIIMIGNARFRYEERKKREP